MPDSRWETVKSLLNSAVALAPELRSGFLEHACSGDASLRAEVESLVESYDRAQGFIETPVVNDAIRLIHETRSRSAAGRRIGQYEVIRELGRGGMGNVYLAARADDQYKKQVAIKLVRLDLNNQFVIARFLDERQILANLEHKNIARLVDGGTTEDGAPYLVMEYIEGLPIDKYCDQNRLSLTDRLKLFRIVCSAVSYAHKNLVIHRDIKPSNIMVTSDGSPKLLDFGIAKIVSAQPDDGRWSQTGTAVRLMTPEYASPEQVRGQTITTSTDIYSLGVLLYKLLTGHQPYRFKASSSHEIERVICEREPERPSTAVDRVEEITESDGVRNIKISPESVSANRRAELDRLRRLLKGDLDNIVMMAMRKEPERRYSSAEQFSEDIRRSIDGLPVIATTDTFGYRARKFIRRNRLPVAASAMILISIVTGISLTVLEKRRADRRFNDVRHMANAVMFEVDDEIQKGPTKARAIVVKRALEYLDSLAKEAGNDLGLQLELAAGYIRVGDIQGKPYRPNLGDTPGALESYRKAEGLLEPLVGASTGALDARYYLSLTYQSKGRVEGRIGDWSTALESQRRAVSLSEELITQDPGNLQYRNLLAHNYLHFGEAMDQPERGATVEDDRKAIEYFRKALAIHEDLIRAEPSNGDYHYAAGVDYEYIGIIFNRLGDMTGDADNYRAALENHQKEFEINVALAKSDTTNATYRRIVADAYGEVGLSLLKLGRTSEALENIRQELAIFESVWSADPTNIEAQHDVANAYHSVGQTLMQTNDARSALEYERKALGIYQKLNEAEPTNTETRTNVLDTNKEIGQLLVRAGDFGGALESYQRAHRLLEAWGAEQPQSVLVRRLLAILNTDIGKVYMRIASDRSTSRIKQDSYRQAAFDWMQQGLSIWQELRVREALNDGDDKRIDELVSEMSRCRVGS